MGGWLSCAVGSQVNKGVFLEDECPHVLKALERASPIDPAVHIWHYFLKTHPRKRTRCTDSIIAVSDVMVKIWP